MKEKAPSWTVKDKVDISEKARRLQSLIDEELRRRETGIPKEHWRWAGIESEPYPRPDLQLIDADYEIYEPMPESNKSSMAWDFYFFIFSIIAAGMLTSWLVVEWCVRAVRGLMQ